MTGSILITFNETGGLVFCFFADSDKETEWLQAWVKEHFSGGRALPLNQGPIHLEPSPSGMGGKGNGITTS